MHKIAIILSLNVSILTFFANKAYCQQEYYIWVDENGVTNYAERAPSGYQPTHVTGKRRFGYKTESKLERPEQSSDKAVEDIKARIIEPGQAIAEEKAMYENELAAQSKQTCELGKQNLARLETFARIKIPGKDGEYRFLSPEEITEKKRESREVILLNCR